MMMTSRWGVSRSWVPLAISVATLLLVIFFSADIAPMFRSAFVELFARNTTETPYPELSKQELRARLLEAESALSRVRYQSMLYELLAAENSELKITATNVEGFSTAVPARVISRPPQSHYDTLLLDVGVEAGIRESDLVVYNGIVLGRIVSTGAASSLAQLFSTPGVERDVLLGDPQAVAVAKGVGAGAFEVLLPREVHVSPGDTVRVPRSETLILGVVVASHGEATDATKIVYFRSPVSLSRIDYVTVLTQSL